MAKDTGTPFENFDDIETGGEPACTFQLGGREWHTKARDDVPWPLVKRFFQAQASGDINGVIVHIDEFFEAVMATDEVDEFMELADDADVMTIKRFQALVAFIAKEAFGNPTQPPGPSRAGRRATRSSSPASLSSPEDVPQTA